MEQPQVQIEDASVYAVASCILHPGAGTTKNGTCRGCRNLELQLLAQLQRERERGDWWNPQYSPIRVRELEMSDLAYKVLQNELKRGE